MLRKKAIWETLTGAHITEAILELMEEMFADFAPVRSRYLAAMEKLAMTHGELCRAEAKAIDSQLGSLVIFSGALGLKANLDHFIDPIRDFLAVDFDVFLREETARSLPSYATAQRARNDFFARLSPAERDIYDAVVVYTSYLETVAPKLAHYYGYILGNELLPQVIPGYHPDSLHTARYAATLTRWAGDGSAA